MLSYLAIFAASLCGYAFLPVWTIAAATLALASLSYAENYWLYRRGNELGLIRQADTTLLSSLMLALCAASGAYVVGVLVRLASHA